MTSRVSIPRRLICSGTVRVIRRLVPAGGKSIGGEKRAEIERDPHAVPLQLDSLDQWAHILCRLDLLKGFDLAVDCLDRLLELGGSETEGFEC